MRTLILLALLLVPPLSAQQEAYQASVPVMSQAPEDRDEAMRRALATVLVRVSGDPSAAAADAILARATQLVQRYAYERDAERQLRLMAAFDPQAVENALKREGLPVWGVYAGEIEEVALSVAGLRSAGDYARVIGALRALPSVNQLQVLEARNDTLYLRLRSEGGAARLSGAISIGGVLSRTSEPSGQLSYVLN